ncbi:sporulation protein YqfD [Thermoanaerobacterium sp. RBIITD]|uniref:sporulation protein YqfD n=1 Tax=Thermoanaerobacterium sp. RBIITD TaxID=1550240 RepID=UPI000BB6B3BC|nr:sporulation protein YqfD [Thermoanaerobacterium sp. RBIITD]SNX55246.1 similar to stage IV sporulation protein [Thermoanaerobacterium sp. RBIITD]
MLAIKLWNFFKGYAIIKVEGLSIEKFINLVISKNIYIWDVERIGFTTIIAKISLKGFKLLQPYTRITNCKVSIVEKRGLPFIILYLKRRRMLVAGALLCMILAYVFSIFVWSIDVKSTKNIDEKSILTELNKLGLKAGVSKSSINISKIQQQFLIDMKDAAWIGIDLKGTKAFVKVIEKTSPPVILPENVPCNIIAKKDGIIYKMTVLEGDAVKKVGETVKTGDVIVSGVIERPNTETRFAHSNGIILGRTWYEGYADVNLTKQENVRTGKANTITRISIGDNNLTLSPKKIDFKSYDKEEKMITSNNSPIKIVRETYYETMPITKKLSRQEAEKVAIEKALENIKPALGKDAKIVSKKENTSMININIVRADITVEVIEDIGTQEKINYNTEVKIERNNN